MSLTIQKLSKQAPRPITVNGEQFYFRSLSVGDVQVLGELPESKIAFFGIGKCLVNQEGAREFPMRDDESPEQFADRLREELRDVPQPVIKELVGVVIDDSLRASAAK